MVESDDAQCLQVISTYPPRLGLYRRWCQMSIANALRGNVLSHKGLPDVVLVRSAKSWLLSASKITNIPKLPHFIVYGCEIPLGVNVPINFMLEDLGCKVSIRSSVLTRL